MRNKPTSIVALEDFIQAVQSQLDTAQARMTLKAQNDSLPLTFAIKDISMDLKAHVEMDSGEVRIKPAGSGDTNASTLHLVFTAITKPMIEENAIQLSTDNQDDTLLEEASVDLTADELTRLDGIGVRTVSQLREVRKQGFGRSVGRITRLPIEKLERVLSQATRPEVKGVEAEDRTSDGRRRLRIRGRNLIRDGQPPRAEINGEAVGVVQASDTDIVLTPRSDQFGGQLSLAFDDKSKTDLWFDIEANAQGEPLSTANAANGEVKELVQ